MMWNYNVLAYMKPHGGTLYSFCTMLCQSDPCLKYILSAATLQTSNKIPIKYMGKINVSNRHKKFVCVQCCLIILR